MKKNHLFGGAVAVVALCLSATAAYADGTAGTPVTASGSGLGMTVGSTTLTISGSVNGFYTFDSPATPGANTTVTGGLASVGNNSSSSVRNGLLPGFIKFDISTKQDGWNVGAHFGMYPGINSAAWGTLGANNGGQPTAFATPGIDFRQVNMTLQRDDFGQILIGREIGLFGSEGILNDMTLLAVGTPGSNITPGNTSLGRIGVGYIYTDFQPQITYSTPKFSGFQASIGVFQPLDSLSSGFVEANKSPQFQGKLTYDGTAAGLKYRVWLSGIDQRHTIETVGATSYTSDGLDTGAKLTYGPLTLTGYYYTASGLGTEALNLFDVNSLGDVRHSGGYYVQGMFTHGKWSLGASYGESYLHHANAADAIAVPFLVDRNESAIGQIRYQLTSWVSLIGEYTHTKAIAYNSNNATSDAAAFGAILFF